MSDTDDSLRRALRERQAAVDRHDHQTVDMLDRAIEQLILRLDRPDGAKGAPDAERADGQLDSARDRG